MQNQGFAGKIKVLNVKKRIENEHELKSTIAFKNSNQKACKQCTCGLIVHCYKSLSQDFHSHLVWF